MWNSYDRAMKFHFDEFILDLSLGQLSRRNEDVAVEPRAFALLSYLVENRERLISKDELVEKIWDGRFISDAAISTLIKTARRAVDDDGKSQKLIRTVHGRGFRFVGSLQKPDVARVTPDVPPESEPQGLQQAMAGGRPSIAVLPFRQIGQSETYGAMADAVPSELIASLSRLRWLRVVARGSTFRFRDGAPDMTEVRNALGATYCLTGDVEIFGSNLAISVELSDTRDGQIVWGERMSGKIDDVHQMRIDIVNLVISALELHISLNEAEHARLRAPESLDAWSLFHLGLRHMYRFNRTDNAIAESHFTRATELDPEFARAYAALSFTNFQVAFLNYKADASVEIANAQRFAERSVELDPMDPFGNFTYGRSQWLRGEPENGQAWIERSINLSPSFARAIYAHGWADVMAGRGVAAVEQLDTAMALSPLDPFLYAMQSAKGLALLHENDLQAASSWADQGARQPGAHYLIGAIAAGINQIAGNEGQAQYWADQTLKRRPDASIAQFFVAFPFRDEPVSKALQDALATLGIPDISRTT